LTPVAGHEHLWLIIIPAVPLMPPASDLIQHAIDRRSERRGDRAYLQELHGAADVKFLVIGGARAAIVSSEDRRRAAVRWFSDAELAALNISTANALFLGVEAKSRTGRFAVVLGDSEADAHMEALAPLVDLRSLVMQGVIGQESFGQLAEAKMLSEWHASAKYCGRCGSETRIKDGGWKIICTACAVEQFPRVDPVVIMLVVHGENCALAHEPRFPEKMYSTLAGFVEPGEDVRSAVRRETREEIGIEVGNVEFFGSQPWPFPNSLMIGCVAEALDDTITIDQNEISHARWFGRSEVRDMLSLKHAYGLFVPGGHAIAHALIRQWADVK
jgi:NAD+ diphosphatase